MERTRNTVFYQSHVNAAAKMVDFAGWQMPIQYPDGIVTEHLLTRRHAGLFDVSHMGRFQVSGSGAVVSEFHMAVPPAPGNFPRRNRIIAGLSMGAIVIEATARSGALLTAKAALENNREVMAIPGKIDSPASVGSNRLIKDGARLVDCTRDRTSHRPEGLFSLEGQRGVRDAPHQEGWPGMQRSQA